jgi:tetratricopeptide (TPR) repeat protein
LTRAVEAAPTNDVARFKRASSLRAMGVGRVVFWQRPTIVLWHCYPTFINFSHTTGAVEDAVLLLKEISGAIPREAAVQAELGVAYVQLGRREEALAALYAALDLDAKNAAEIRAVIDGIDDPGVDIDGLMALIA